MTKTTEKIYKEILKEITPNKEAQEKIAFILKDFQRKLKNQISKLNIEAEIFIGGSYAKKTLIQKEKYDVDIFIRFNEKYPNQEISKLTKNILTNLKPKPNLRILHGSRDYFQISATKNIELEILPVKKSPSPEKAENITDLSYSHVSYVNKKAKAKRVLDEIKISKAFTHACNCYGAESYIQGFSGYALELLILHYKSFEKFLRETIKVKTGKQLIIDIEKQFKRPSEVLLELNSSKLQSPIILVDPTYKKRNVLAALSQETFEKFQTHARNFLKKPSINFFHKTQINLEKEKTKAEKNKNQFLILEIQTAKQPGDIAGTKLLKFYKHLNQEISKVFDIKNSGFLYNEKQSARIFLSVKPKKQIVFQGPNLKEKHHVKKFKKIHKKTLIKNNTIYAKEIPIQSLKEFLNVWTKNKANKRKIREMYVKNFKIVE